MKPTSRQSTVGSWLRRQNRKKRLDACSHNFCYFIVMCDRMNGERDLEMEACFRLVFPPLSPDRLKTLRGKGEASLRSETSRRASMWWSITVTWCCWPMPKRERTATLRTQKRAATCTTSSITAKTTGTCF